MKNLVITSIDTQWKLLLQEGIFFSIPTSTCFNDFFLSLGFSQVDINTTFETVLLNGMPVDSLNDVLLTDTDRIALANALPGTAGIMMRRQSPYAIMRQEISFAQKEACHHTQSETCIVSLRVFSLLLNAYYSTLFTNPLLIPAKVLCKYISATTGTSYAWNNTPVIQTELQEQLKNTVTPATLIPTTIHLEI